MLAGTLGVGGSEKQLVYLARALSRRQVKVRVYSLTRGEFYEDVLRQHRIPVHWVGGVGNPIYRLFRLTVMLGQFKPHILQSMHGFANLYCALAARPVGALSLGALRNDLSLSLAKNGPWVRWLMRLPDSLIVNSQTVLAQVQRNEAFSQVNLQALPNCIDTTDYDTDYDDDRARMPTAIFVGRLVPSKRLDLFLEALSLARREISSFTGIVLGDGPELIPMRQRALELGLFPDGVHFAGHCSQPIPWLLKSTMLVFCSDSEGSPNVILEGMAARLPVVTTAAGDIASIVQDGKNGYIVPFNDPGGLAQKMVSLARCPQLQRNIGQAGRQLVEHNHGIDTLGARLLSIYRLVASQKNREPVLWALQDRKT